MTRRAVVLFGHGSRDPLWRLPIEAVAARAQALAPEVAVACAYLELTEPDLPSVTTALVDGGATDIRVVPMFLGVGRHAREDLPALVEALRQQYPGVQFELQAAIGEHPQLLELMAAIAVG
ncbi:CbiX/SirB N-terminal domain-containing protein [Xylophilus sp. GW821-FHT01B05]